jgi:hypothetical protein
MLARRRLLAAVTHFNETGEAPPASNPNDVYAGVRGGFFIAPKGKQLSEVYAQQIESTK